MFDEQEDPQESQLITLEEAEQDAADMASVVAEFYRSLTENGVPEKYAFRLTRDYMICTFGGEVYL